jgi:signal transduction histidine kinase
MSPIVGPDLARNIALGPTFTLGIAPILKRPSTCHDCSMARPHQARLALAGAVGAAALGVAAELVAFDLSSARSWIPDLSVGWGLVSCGLVGWRIAPHSRCGPLLCGAGLAWFAGNFAAADVPILPWAAEHGAYVHRGVLAAAVLAFALGRVDSDVARLGVAAISVALLWPSLADDEAAVVVLALALLVVSLWIGGRRPAPAAFAFALAVGGVAAVRLLDWPVGEGALLSSYQAGLLATGMLLVLALSRRASAAAVAEHVIELGETGSVGDALRRVLGDRSLELAFVRGEAHVDEHGRPLSIAVLPHRCLTALGAEGLIVVAHDVAVHVDDALAGALARALGLTRENALLQADALDQLDELRASRRRLVLARGRQRALLARRLGEGAERHLLELDEAIAAVDPSDGELADAVVEVRRRVREAREGLAALALGLQPRVLASGGLAGAVAGLAEGSPLSVTFDVDPRRFDAAVEHAAYLVCSEALANAAKHADATNVAIRVETRNDRLGIEIEDDGRGGANPDGGGLRGLEQRLDELGGTLRVKSTPGTGTRIEAEIPLRGDREESTASERNDAPRTGATAVGAAS